MKTMPSGSVGIAVQNDGLHVVEQHFARHTAEVGAGSDQAVAHRVKILTDAKTDKTHPAVAERGNKRREWMLAPEGNEIDLHLLTGCRLEPDNGATVVPHRLHRRQKDFEL